jgi:hypothetical protein
MKKRYPVTVVILTVALTFVDFSARLDFRLVNSSLNCQLRNLNSGNLVSVADIGQFKDPGALQDLDLKEHKWTAVPHGFHNSEVLDYGGMTFSGYLIETSPNIWARLVGNSGGIYYVFDSLDGKVLIMSGMLDCSD